MLLAARLDQPLFQVGILEQPVAGAAAAAAVVARRLLLLCVGAPVRLCKKSY